MALAILTGYPDVSSARPATPEPVPDVLLDASLELARSGSPGYSTSFDRTYDPGESGFAMKVRDVRVTHRVLAVTALPGEALQLRPEAGDGVTFTLRYESGGARTVSPGVWEWAAPDRPGLYPLRMETSTGESIHLNVLVMYARERVRDGALNGYAIGSYRSRPLKGDPVYLPPVGFVEASAGNEDVLVSPHFTLGQFLCKQPGQPRYLAFSVPLVQKLEIVLAAVNEAGYSTNSLYVMSGFRTPAYNAAIGNKTVYSRHLWGDAADIFVDVDGDRQMDDLNRDGRSDVRDARVLYDIVDRLDRHGSAAKAGGLGAYKRNAAHGPFVHVDARGTPARW